MGVPELTGRKWSKSMIIKLMPDHDDECASPFRSTMKLYDRKRVKRIERTKKWKGLHSKFVM